MCYPFFSRTSLGFIMGHRPWVKNRNHCHISANIAHGKILMIVLHSKQVSRIPNVLSVFFSDLSGVHNGSSTLGQKSEPLPYLSQYCTWENFDDSFT